MPSPVRHIILPRKSECFDKIQELKAHYGAEATARLLGVRVITLGYKDQLIPVVQLAYLWHRMTFNPSPPMTTLEYLLLGKYGTAPPQTSPAQPYKRTPQCSAAHGIGVLEQDRGL
jgi:hypothetical protein